ncbi:MAG TPA: TRAP transporter small permease subunit [Burkholderiaceae bacterium]|jgi:TRAP-type mannitol/chloroaromatic compound transport system permease small subunit|nr:TRAP transporter small permease subunit [Burkholderiaceae bacterium]
MRSFITGIDQLSKMVGHAFAWCIIILTLGTSYEVFMRYLLNDPTSWAFDMSYVLYGALFMMAGPYTLSRNAHVRADIFYRLWKPVTQARLEFVLYFLFYFPGVLALVFYGYSYGADAMRVREASVYSPVGLPVWPLKMLIPIAGVLLTLQGIAEVLRCVICMREGQWPPRLHDVEELETQLARGETPAQVYLDPEQGVQKRGAKSE